MHDPGNRQPVLRLWIPHRMTAQNRNPCLRSLALSPGENLGQKGDRQLARETDQVEGKEGLGSHRPDVGKGVGSGDLAELKGSSMIGGKKSTVSTTASDEDSW